MKKRPYTINIFLPDGNPNGLKVITKSNWLGLGLVIPRSDLESLSARNEANSTGVYFLCGYDENGDAHLYLGEAEDVSRRLAQHNSKKDFWTWALVFVNKDNSLNKAHVKYLESRLIDLAGISARYKLENNASATQSSLTEQDEADMESYLEDILDILPLVGLTHFGDEKQYLDSGEDANDFDDTLLLKGRGASGIGAEHPQGFIVFKDSKAAGDEVESIHAYMSTLRSKLISDGVFVEEETGYRLDRDYVFNSPTTAAGVLMGRVANGRTDWKTKSGQSLKDIQEKLLGTADANRGRSNVLQTDDKAFGTFWREHGLGMPKHTAQHEDICKKLIEAVLKMDPEISVKSDKHGFLFRHPKKRMFYAITPQKTKLTIAPIHVRPEQLHSMNLSCRDISDKKYAYGGLVRVDFFDDTDDSFDQALNLARMSLESEEIIKTWAIAR